MPLNDLQIKRAKPTNKKQTLSDGGGLALMINPISRGGTKYFVSLHTTKNQHQPIFMGLGVKKLTNCRNTALSLFNNTKRKPSINKSKPNANKLA